MRPRLQLNGNDCALVTEVDGVFVVEMMQFVSLWRARKDAQPQTPYHQLHWCPREHRPLYKDLRRKQIPANEARALVEDHMARRAG